MAFTSRNKKIFLALTLQIEDIRTKLEAVWEQETERFDEMTDVKQESDDGEAHREALGTIEAAFKALDEVTESLNELKDL